MDITEGVEPMFLCESSPANSERAGVWSFSPQPDSNVGELAFFPLNIANS